MSTQEGLAQLSFQLSHEPPQVKENINIKVLYVCIVFTICNHFMCLISTLHFIILQNHHYSLYVKHHFTQMLVTEHCVHKECHVAIHLLYRLLLI